MFGIVRVVRVVKSRENKKNTTKTRPYFDVKSPSIYSGEVGVFGIFRNIKETNLASVNKVSCLLFLLERTTITAMNSTPIPYTPY